MTKEQLKNCHLSDRFIHLSSGNEYGVSGIISARKKRIAQGEWINEPESVLYFNEKKEIFEDTLESFLQRFEPKQS